MGEDLKQHESQLVGENDVPLEELQQLEKLSEIVEKIEKAKQEAAIKEIEAVDKDNERQYRYALKKLESDERKWTKSFWAGAIATAILGISGLVFLFLDKTEIGIGLLTTTFAGVFGYIAGAGNCKGE